MFHLFPQRPSRPTIRWTPTFLTALIALASALWLAAPAHAISDVQAEAREQRLLREELRKEAELRLARQQKLEAQRVASATKTAPVMTSAAAKR